MSLRIVALDGLNEVAAEKLKVLKDVDIEILKGAEESEKRTKAKKADIILVRSASKVNREFLEETKPLKLIVRAGIGLDNVDVPAATELGAIVMNTPFGNRVTTAEHAVAMMMSLMRHIPQATASMKANKWEKKKFTGRELNRKVLGVVGLGNIGQIVSERALGLGLKVMAYDPFISAEQAAKLNVEKVTLDELYSRSDIVTVHVPINDQTRHLINKEAFNKMRQGVFLINCARGGIVHEKDLVDALNSGKVSAAAVDVFEQEPPEADHPLVQHPNVICTPHLGASTDEAQLAVSIEAAEQIVDFVNEGTVRNAVNHPNLNAQKLQALGPHVRLVEKMGIFLGHWCCGDKELVNKVEVKYRGVKLEDQKVLTLSFLKCFLGPIFGDSINFVNARNMAQGHEIGVVESTGDLSADFSKVIQVHIHRDSGPPLFLEGALFGKNEPRFVTFNQFKTDANPEGWVLVTLNKDVPNMIGTIGTLLGSYNINIANMNLGRGRETPLAFAMTAVDSEIPLDVLDKLKNTEGIELVKQINLEGTSF